MADLDNDARLSSRQFAETFAGQRQDVEAHVNHLPDRYSGFQTNRVNRFNYTK